MATVVVAGYDNRLSVIERDLTLLKWMVGTNVALTLLVLGALVGLAVRLLPLKP